MKYRIIRQVPGVYQFELARIEYECDTPEEAAKADAYADAWAARRRESLPQSVRAQFDVEGRAQGGAASHAPAPAHHAQAPRAPVHGQSTRPTDSLPAGESVGFPYSGYQDLLARWAQACGLDNNQRATMESNLVRAASRYIGKKDGLVKFIGAPTLLQAARDYKAKGWEMKSITRAWEEMIRMEKILMADGHITLVVPQWSKELGRATDKHVTYSLLDVSGAQSAVEAAGLSAFGREPGEDPPEQGVDDGVPF